MKKILVAIANYGEGTEFADRLIKTYRDYTRYEVQIVILSNIEKDFGSDIEVKVGLPDPNPWSLPFAHRPLFDEQQDDYDLFIYSEDDTEVTERHIDAFLEATEILPENKIAGFLRYERSPEGKVYYSTIHAHYYWDPQSITKYGNQVFARYTNDHAACFILTRDHLKKCIASGGFLIPPHEGPYDMLCSAATDPYTRCGLEKVINISKIDDFCLHHLADKYLGTIGVEKDEIDLQIKKMIELADNNETRGPIFKPQPDDLEISHLGKRFFEKERPEILENIPSDAKRLLSIGCERGLTEAALMKKGHEVTAIPIDSIIAESARHQGIQTVTADLEKALEELKGEQFDCLILNNVIAFMPYPEKIIRNYLSLLKPGGYVLTTYENYLHLSQMKQRFKGDPVALRLNTGNGFEENGMHSTNPKMVRNWLKQCGLTILEESYLLSEQDKKLSKLSMGLLQPRLGRRGVILARA